MFFFDNRGTDGRQSILPCCETYSLSKNFHEEIDNAYHFIMSVPVRPCGRGNDVCNEGKFSVWSTLLLHPKFYQQTIEDDHLLAYISGFHPNLTDSSHLLLFQGLPSGSPSCHFSLPEFKGRGISPAK